MDHRSSANDDSSRSWLLGPPTMVDSSRFWAIGTRARVVRRKVVIRINLIFTSGHDFTPLHPSSEGCRRAYKRLLGMLICILAVFAFPQWSPSLSGEASSMRGAKAREERGVRRPRSEERGERAARSEVREERRPSRATSDDQAERRAASEPSDERRGSRASSDE